MSGPNLNTTYVPFPRGGFRAISVDTDGVYEIAIDGRIDNYNSGPVVYDYIIETSGVALTMYPFSETLNPGDMFWYSQRILVPLSANDEVAVAIFPSSDLLQFETFQQFAFVSDGTEIDNTLVIPIIPNSSLYAIVQVYTTNIDSVNVEVDYNGIAIPSISYNTVDNTLITVLAAIQYDTTMINPNYNVEYILDGTSGDIFIVTFVTVYNASFDTNDNFNPISFQGMAPVAIANAFNPGPQFTLTAVSCFDDTSTPVITLTSGNDTYVQIGTTVSGFTSLIGLGLVDSDTISQVADNLTSKNIMLATNSLSQAKLNPLTTNAANLSVVYAGPLP
jgi:hypothetical protein